MSHAAKADAFAASIEQVARRIAAVIVAVYVAGLIVGEHVWPVVQRIRRSLVTLGFILPSIAPKEVACTASPVKSVAALPAAVPTASNSLKPLPTSRKKTAGRSPGTKAPSASATVGRSRKSRSASPRKSELVVA